MAGVNTHICQCCGEEYTFNKDDDVIECPNCGCVEFWGGWKIIKTPNKKEEKFYPITRLCKQDLRNEFKGNEKALKKIEELDDADMKMLASKMADDYLEQLYWWSMRTIFEELFLKEED